MFFLFLTTIDNSIEEPQKSIHEIAKTLVGSKLPVKVVQADEENRKLILSEKLALWPKYSQNVSVGDVFNGRVGSVEDYGAFIHLRFSDGILLLVLYGSFASEGVALMEMCGGVGLYHLTGLVHVSEVSWDYVQDVRDVLRDGDEVRVIVTNIDK